MDCRRARVILPLFVAVIATGCPDTDPVEPSDKVCEAGRQVSCDCLGGLQGIQLCKEDGSGYGECQCPSPSSSGVVVASSSGQVSSAAPPSSTATSAPPSSAGGSSSAATSAPPSSAGSSSSTEASSSSAALPVCNNGVPETGEECDDGNPVIDDGCTPDCRYSCHALADCDDGDPCTADSCVATGAGWACSHAVQDNAPCEDGNRCTVGDACNVLGQCVPGANTCTCETADDCTPFEDGNLCNGTLACRESRCVIDPATVVTCDASQDTACRVQRCNPQSGTCSPVNEPDGRGCEDGLFCTTADSCQGGECVGGRSPCAGLGCAAACDEENDRCTPRGARDVCRPVAGPCDVEELCDGTALTCPDDAKRPVQTTCRPADGLCDAPEVCNGISAACPDDGLLVRGTPCRDVAGVCDVAEFCDGESRGCPQDRMAEATVLCRGAAGDCDLPESCTGDTPDCPEDLLAVDSVCRDVVGNCDVPEVCNGASVDCPDDGVLDQGLVCRSVAGACDVLERCDGVSGLCPPQVVLGAETQCRPSVGLCDRVEHCDGRATACPPDTRVGAGVVCRVPAGDCDLAEECDGRAADCPPDRYAGADTECRVSGGACDITETCPGNGPDCPLDVLRGPETTCRPANGRCDVAEVCDGARKVCPDDLVALLGTSCRAAASSCDVEEFCDGNLATCPADGFRRESTSCTTGNACMVDEQCNPSGVCGGGTYRAPPVPEPIGPSVGTFTGSVHAPARFNVARPLFNWSAVPDDRCGAVTYDVQVDDSCDVATFPTCVFPSPEASSSGITTLSWRPDQDLPVATTVPVGTRYFWRIRACRNGSCSAWAPARYLEVGRSRGDFDGDGYADLAVSAPQAAPDGAAEGTVSVFMGSATGVPLTASVVLRGTGTQAGASFGHALSTGDLNADGFMDLAVGAPLLDADNEDEGSVFVFLGSPTGLKETADLVLRNPVPQKGSQFGFTVSLEGDVDGDGYGDLVAGSPYHDVGETADVGLLHVYLGGAAGLPGLPDWVVDHPALRAGAVFGYSLSTGGDMDGNGTCDIAVGAAGITTWYILYTSPGGILAQPNLTSAWSAYWGYALSMGGAPSDGDGFPGLAVGTGSEWDWGHHCLYKGNRTGVTNRWCRNYGRYWDRPAFSISQGGDVNGDGYGDTLFGNIGYENVYLLFGGAPLTDQPAVGNPYPGDGDFGHSVTNRLDLNGDGFSDVVVGAPLHNFMYVFHGTGSGILDTPTVEVLGSGRFGHTVLR